MINYFIIIINVIYVCKQTTWFLRKNMLDVILKSIADIIWGHKKRVEISSY